VSSKASSSYGLSRNAREVVLELDSVSARYASSRDMPLRSFSLAIGAGELVVVLGPNGAGKSTLLRVLSGALTPTEGEVRLFGHPIGTRSRRLIASELAVVSQSEEVAFGYSVRDVVMMGRAAHQGDWMRASPNDHAIVERAIVRCDLGDLVDRAVSELSGGEQKRVAIARALAQAPRVLLLDEPTVFLDVRHQVALFDLLEEEVARGLACVAVMHDLNAAAQYASRVVLLKAGRLVAAGTVDEVMTQAHLRETFDSDLYVGESEAMGARIFLPMRTRARAST